MVDTKEKKKVHQGRNIRIARHWKEMTQETLADLLGNKLQSYVSKLERTETLDTNTLQEVAKALEVDVNFLETFEPEELLSSHHFEQNNNNSEESTNKIIYGDDNDMTISKVNEIIDRVVYYERVIADMRIAMAKAGVDFEVPLYDK